MQNSLDQIASSDMAAERKMLLEGNTLREEMNVKEWRRRWKVRNARVENDRRIAWQWKKLLRELTDERGEGRRGGEEEEEVEEARWKLDKTENFSRMRLKLRRNWNFDPHSEAAHEIARGIKEEEEKKEGEGKGEGGGEGEGGEKGEGEEGEKKEGEKQSLPPNPLKIQGVKLEDILKTPEGGETKREEGDKRMEGRHTIKSGAYGGGSEEKEVYSTACDLITPMKATPGRLEITTTHIYFWETMELRGKEDIHRAPKDRKWRLEQLREIHVRRYLLRRLGFFLVFCFGFLVFWLLFLLSSSHPFSSSIDHPSNSS